MQQSTAPPALETVRNLATQLCSSTAQQYYPEQLEIAATKITAQRVQELQAHNPSASTRRNLDTLIENAGPTMASLLTAAKQQQPNQPNKQTAKGAEVQKIVDELKADPSRILTENGQDIELEVGAVLPSYRAAVVTPKKTGLVNRILGRAFSVPKAEAQTPKTMEFYWFYAQGESPDSNWSSHLLTTMNNIKSFYESRSGRQISVVSKGLIQGEKTLAGYGASCTLGSRTDQGNIYALFCNADAEMKRRVVSPDKIVHIIAQNSPDQAAGGCGGGRAWIGQVSNPNAYSQAWGVSGDYLNCQRSGIPGYVQSSAAHEIFHNLGFDHLGDGSLMHDSQLGPNVQNKCPDLGPACFINAGQLDALKTYSPYFGSPPASATVRSSRGRGFGTSFASFRGGDCGAGYSVLDSTKSCDSPAIFPTNVAPHALGVLASVTQDGYSYELAGFTVCYSTDPSCHTSDKLQKGSAVYSFTPANNQTVDVYWHYNLVSGSPAPATDDTFLNITVNGYGGELIFTSNPLNTTTYTARHTVGRCTGEAGLSIYEFRVTGFRKCTGERLRPSLWWLQMLLATQSNGKAARQVPGAMTVI